MWKLSDDYFSMAEGNLMPKDAECLQPLIVHCADIAAWAAH